MCSVWLSQHITLVSTHNLNGLVFCNEHGACSLWGTNWVFMRKVGRFHSRAFFKVVIMQPFTANMSTMPDFEVMSHKFDDYIMSSSQNVIHIDNNADVHVEVNIQHERMFLIYGQNCSFLASIQTNVIFGSNVSPCLAVNLNAAG
jgi:hypothetical protein